MICVLLGNKILNSPFYTKIPYFNNILAFKINQNYSKELVIETTVKDILVKSNIDFDNLVLCLYTTYHHYLK